MGKLMEKERIFLKTDKYMKENMLMIRKKDLVYFTLMRIKSILDNGKMISHMEME